MKKLIVFTLMVAGLSAQASVWECQVSNSKTQYLIAVDPMGAGLVFEKDSSSERASYSAIQGEVTHQAAADGGPTHVFLKRAPEVVEWKKLKACFAWQEPHLSFTLGRNTAEMQAMPNLVVRPGARLCSIPRVMRGRPVPMNCTRL